MSGKNAFLKPVSVLALAALLFFACCKKQPDNFSVNYQYNYYPIDSGHSITYNVDSVTFNYDGINWNRDTVQYQMMVVFGDTIHDLLDSVNFLLSYYTRPNASSAWSAPYVTYCLRTQTNIQVIENDIRFIKLVFPPQLNETWNGNLYVPVDNNINSAYTTFQGWTGYTYENVDTSMMLNGLNYNNAVVVSEDNSINNLTKNLRTEVYAPNVGMIYQEWESLDKNNSIGGNITLGWDTGAAQGFSIHMWAIAHYP